MVAGNEGSPGTPSDAYNILVGRGRRACVGRPFPYNAGPLQHLERHAGWPDRRESARPGVATLPRLAGQPSLMPFLLASSPTAISTHPPAASTNFRVPPARSRFSSNDALSGVTSANSANVTDTGAPQLAGPPTSNFPLVNPGAVLGGTDSVQSNPIAGTSFAAPTVAAAGALLVQYANIVSANPAVNPSFALNNADPIDQMRP